MCWIFPGTYVECGKRIGGRKVEMEEVRGEGGGEGDERWERREAGS